jgi:1-acyl-sn-glycerol-3-phosphate acyltransferase
VARRRYERFVPLVSASIRLLGCPIVDPRRDPRGAVEAVRRGARELPHGISIFPEGHRSVDGAVRPFRAAGLEAFLRERRVPVYLVVNDGVFQVRRLADLLFQVHLIDGPPSVRARSSPGDDERLPEFIEGLRGRLVHRLSELRAEAAPRSA